ncbi:MAG: Lrp/AsnC ligand binding domain-containing protein [Candidatus Thermoplasmatota archaeon]|nr:Lrp/AsnC ligand binding domain-containing protein [Candidatus Thermoplasmatota archaeon]MDI6856143.1 Lrp/AsnC ligand binding domain-containing protein [Candidatus Thermoplasmatota archaeon]
MEFVYVLIKVASGTVESVASKIAEFKNVKEVSIVTGAYDIIAKIESEYITDILTTVVRGLRQVEGVVSTETLVVVKL